jgi:hypothetical protein
VNREQRARLRIYLAEIILATVPFYCLGILALLLRR